MQHCKSCSPFPAHQEEQEWLQAHRSVLTNTPALRLECCIQILQPHLRAESSGCLLGTGTSMGKEHPLTSNRSYWGRGVYVNVALTLNLLALRLPVFHIHFFFPPLAPFEYITVTSSLPSWGIHTHIFCIFSSTGHFSSPADRWCVTTDSFMPAKNPAPYILSLFITQHYYSVK